MLLNGSTLLPPCAGDEHGQWQRGTKLPSCIDFSSTHKFWIVLLTGSWFSTLVTAQSLIPSREGKCDPQKLLQIRQRRELSTSVPWENVPCVFWIQPKNSLRWGVSLKMLPLLLFCQDLRLGYRYDFYCDSTWNPKGQVPAQLDTERHCLFPRELAVEVGKMIDSGQVEKQRHTLTCLSILSHLDWPEGGYSSSVVVCYIVKPHFITCSHVWMPGLAVREWLGTRSWWCGHSNTQACTWLLQPAWEIAIVPWKGHVRSCSEGRRYELALGNRRTN